jgi:hypothetical protein
MGLDLDLGAFPVLSVDFERIVSACDHQPGSTLFILLGNNTVADNSKELTV